MPVPNDCNRNDDRGTVCVLDPDGRRRAISRTRKGVRGLAWSPRGREVWYSASGTGGKLSITASTLDGSERMLAETLSVERASLCDIQASG